MEFHFPQEQGWIFFKKNLNNTCKLYILDSQALIIHSVMKAIKTFIELIIHMSSCSIGWQYYSQKTLIHILCKILDHI